MLVIILILLTISNGIGMLNGFPAIEPEPDNPGIPGNFVPKISSPNINVEIGHSFTLDCTVGRLGTETPAPAAWVNGTVTTWLKNNNYMKVSDNLIQTVEKLKIKKSSVEDAGTYTCIRCIGYSCKHSYFVVNVVQPVQGITHLNDVNL